MDESRDELRRRLERAEAILASLRDEEVDAVVGRSGVSMLRLRQMEQDLRESEQQLRIAMDAARLAAWEVDLSSGEVTASPRLCEMFGFSLEEAPKDRQQWLDLIVDEDRQRVRGIVERSVAEEREYEIQFRVLRPHGEVRWLRSQATPICDEHGEPDRAIGVVEDITGRKRAESRLREREERLRLATQIGGIGTWHLDVSSRRLTLSERARSIYDLPPRGEVSVEQVLEKVHPEDRSGVLRAIDEALETCSDYENEYRVVHGSDAVRWVKINCQTFSDRAGRPTDNLGVVMDITAQKTYERRLEAFNEMLEQRVAERTREVRRQSDQLRALAAQLSNAEQRERRRLAQIVHNQIQQLITAARMHTQRLGRECDSARLEEGVQKTVRILQEALATCRSLAVDLSPPVLHRAGLGSGLKWLASRMQEQHELTVNVCYEALSGPVGEGVKFFLFECVRELLFNVVKHAGVGEARVRALRTGDERIKITVQDKGSGFSPDVLRSRQSEEAGFGLFRIRERLAHMGGCMEIESAPGEGTKVVLTAPSGQEDFAEKDRRQEITESPAVLPAAEPGKPGGCRVLIVDDHQMMREGLVQLFQAEADIDVVAEAADGYEAIELAQKLNPDVVIMDVNLGSMSGVEATERIVSNGSRAKVVGLSMHMDGQVASAMRDAGAVAYLTKDAPGEKLVAAVRACRPV